ncbi:GL26173 [Drosophila persimilis]|uniref:Nuclear transcription factor Y subunit B-1 n=2 Tax=pseudoobscura subgroup TaxID=32358 RepID=Q29K08_DROPS|nr:nuclear transcription factor Y subunit B-1 [Drosophila pseudoobscura]XP_002019077.1 nuclear transcription factor Y subunit B-1 [Drosophila persimilis]XP_017152786.1 nuclear transcription factor Y subunit B-1 [Drosophila miranda]EDW37273.1 GL26173 [Drosophila persimilis]
MSNSEDSQQYITDMMVKEEDEASGDESDKQDNGIMLREQDRFLPICNIIKIMKVPVPQNGKIAKDARECIQECVSEFISFISSEAIERSVAENRKTVNGDDLIAAFGNLGFDNYVEPLQIYLNKYRESNKADRNLFMDTNFAQNEDGSTTNEGAKP